MLNPTSMSVFYIVASSAVVVLALAEARMVGLPFGVRGAAALSFIACMVTNGTVLQFQPLLAGSRSLPVPVPEAVVVLIVEAVIKLLVAVDLGVDVAEDAALLPSCVPPLPRRATASPGRAPVPPHSSLHSQSLRRKSGEV